jgi:hypothetical protein
MAAILKILGAVAGLVWMLFVFTMLTIVLPIQVFLNML